MVDGLTLAGFVVVVLLGGVNLVSVRLSNRGLPPFFGAGLRFLVASALLFAYVVWRRVPLPTRAELPGTIVFGVLGFGGFYAFGYWALVTLPAGVAAVLSASVPLMTLLLASLHRLERITLRGLAGALLAMAGIGLMMAGRGGGLLLPAAVLSTLAAACEAEATVLLKKLPIGNPIGTNAVASAIGAGLLLILSGVAGESWRLPTDFPTVVTLAYLILLGTIALFVVYIHTLKRWTASGMSYLFVLMPVVATLVGRWLLKEAITPAILGGGVIVLFGVYVGALSGRGAST